LERSRRAATLRQLVYDSRLVRQTGLAGTAWLVS